MVWCFHVTASSEQFTDCFLGSDSFQRRENKTRLIWGSWIWQYQMLAVPHEYTVESALKKRNIFFCLDFSNWNERPLGLFWEICVHFVLGLPLKFLDFVKKYYLSIHVFADSKVQTGNNVWLLEHVQYSVLIAHVWHWGKRSKGVDTLPEQAKTVFSWLKIN